ncbi:hypothetical protein KFK09_011595 [Dendrobium nobile]|uniref:Uncharacterized protein n=1 Tax=Dendrobium nobile TaxID=94219 RepID=A0A8T3BD13_DENNO|nr:hypothetical protein KFK09_011595 [Dendrobium nobile]
MGFCDAKRKEEVTAASEKSSTFFLIKDVMKMASIFSGSSAMVEAFLHCAFHGGVAFMLYSRQVDLQSLEVAKAPTHSLRRATFTAQSSNSHRFARVFFTSSHAVRGCSTLTASPERRLGFALNLFRCCCSSSLLRLSFCTSRFFGSFVAVRLRSLDDVPFLRIESLDILIGSNYVELDRWIVRKNSARDCQQVIDLLEISSDIAVSFSFIKHGVITMKTFDNVSKEMPWRVLEKKGAYNAYIQVIKEDAMMMASTSTGSLAMVVSFSIVLCMCLCWFHLEWQGINASRMASSGNRCCQPLFWLFRA